MTIYDLLQNFAVDTKIEVTLQTVNPFKKDDKLYNTLYVGTIREVYRQSLIPYHNTPITNCKLCLDSACRPFISVLLKGGFV